MKKIITILLAVLLSMSFFITNACSKKTDYTIGILQLAEHPALDAANEGFRTELDKLMKEAGKTVKYNNKNAQGNIDNCTTIANTHIANNVDLILAIATPAAQAAVAASNNTIPVLFTAVTDAVDAGLVQSNEEPKYKVSGTSDLNPVELQIKLIKELVPNVKKIAAIYNKAERNSQIQYEMAKEVCQKEGITLVDKAINDINDLQITFGGLESDIDAVYIPTDNMLASSSAAVHSVNKDTKKLPIVCGEIGMNDLCGVATYGIDYYKLGEQTARMAFKVLVEGQDITKMPVELLEEYVFSVNQTVANEINFTIPQSVLDRAK